MINVICIECEWEGEVDENCVNCPNCGADDSLMTDDKLEEDDDYEEEDGE